MRVSINLIFFFGALPPFFEMSTSKNGCQTAWLGGTHQGGERVSELLSKG